MISVDLVSTVLMSYVILSGRDVCYYFTISGHHRDRAYLNAVYVSTAAYLYSTLFYSYEL